MAEQPYTWPLTGEMLVLPAAHREVRRAVPVFTPRRAVPGYVPAPPDDSERDSYSSRNVIPLAVAMLASFGVLAGLVQMMVTSWVLLAVFSLPALLTGFYYVISVRVNIFAPGFSLDGHRRLVREFSPRRWPSLDIFLPVCGERPEVLQNTWQHVSRLCLRYPGMVSVFVLDDGADPEAQAMAAESGFIYAVRPNRGWYKKAGNLRHAFERAAGDFIMILDADFAPPGGHAGGDDPVLLRRPGSWDCPVPSVLSHNQATVVD